MPERYSNKITKLQSNILNQTKKKLKQMIEAQKEQHNLKLEKLKMKLIGENTDLEFIEFRKILDMKENFISTFQTKDKQNVE